MGITQIGQRSEVVEVPAVHLAGVAHDDDRSRDLAQHSRQRGDVDRTTRCRRLADLIAAKAERAQTLEGAEVDLGA
jgi:hypothetical protein